MDSNQGPSACKADALNQLSYAPVKEGAKIKLFPFLPKDPVNKWRQMTVIVDRLTIAIVNAGDLLFRTE